MMATLNFGFAGARTTSKAPLVLFDPHAPIATTALLVSAKKIGESGIDLAAGHLSRQRGRKVVEMTSK
jgi:hypothetical protein